MPAYMIRRCAGRSRTCLKMIFRPNIFVGILNRNLNFEMGSSQFQIILHSEIVMMTPDNQDKKTATMGRIWLKRIWGLLPILVLAAIIILLSGFIRAKTDRLDTVRKGLRNLEGMETATSEIDRVTKILTESKDQNQAALTLSADLGLTEDQAKAVLNMPFSTLVRFEQERLAGQIAYIQNQIAANKLDMPAGPADVNVIALSMEPGVLSDRINLPGVIAPWVKFDIAAEVRGQVIEKRIEKGSTVREGDVIAVIDPRDYEIAVDAARASFNTALTSKNRIERLYQQEMAPLSQLDDITAQLALFRAELDKARLNLSRCTIRSPIDGIINNVYIDRGQYVNVADPVAGIMNIDKVKASVGIPESDVTAVRGVNEFDVTLDALDGKVFTARKHFLARSADPAARLYDLELEIDNPEQAILPDMFARVKIVKRQRRDALAVPLYAIIPIDGVQTVYVLSDGAAKATRIETGIQEGWLIEVTEGLHPGDAVIVVGHREVSDGQKVNVVRTVTDATNL